MMLDCAGITRGMLVLRNYITPEEIAPLIKGTVVEKYRQVADDRTRIREELIEELAGLQEPAGATGRGAVPVDHFFPVKGIGVVVLGGVVGGAISRHDVLRIYPTTLTAQVRSIQKHEDYVDSAGTGDRVGLALKGVEVENLDRGFVLSANPDLTSSLTTEWQGIPGPVLAFTAEERYDHPCGPLDAVPPGTGSICGQFRRLETAAGYPPDQPGPGLFPW